MATPEPFRNDKGEPIYVSYCDATSRPIGAGTLADLGHRDPARSEGGRSADAAWIGDVEVNHNILPLLAILQIAFYWKGDKAKYTGAFEVVHGERFYEAVLLEGHGHGCKVWTSRSPDKAVSV